MTTTTDQLTIADAVGMAAHARARAERVASCCSSDEAREAYVALMSEAVAIRSLARDGAFGRDALDTIPVYGALMAEANAVLDAELATWAVDDA
jgi:hypothetical protein